MKEGIEEPSGTEQGEIPWIYEACFLLDSISTQTEDIMRRIESVTRRVNSLSGGIAQMRAFSIMPLDERYEMGKMEKIDALDWHGICIVNELLADETEAVLHLPVLGIHLEQEDVAGLMNVWIGFFHGRVAERRVQCQGLSKKIHIRIRFFRDTSLTGVFQFYIERE